jgi:hypothetical protein
MREAVAIILLLLVCLAPFVTVHYVWKYVRKSGAVKTILGLTLGLTISAIMFFLFSLLMIYMISLHKSEHFLQ